MNKEKNDHFLMGHVEEKLMFVHRAEKLWQQVKSKKLLTEEKAVLKNELKQIQKILQMKTKEFVEFIEKGGQNKTSLVELMKSSGKVKTKKKPHCEIPREIPKNKRLGRCVNSLCSLSFLWCRQDKICPPCPQCSANALGLI